MDATKDHQPRRPFDAKNGDCAAGTTVKEKANAKKHGTGVTQIRRILPGAPGARTVTDEQIERAVEAVFAARRAASAG